MAVLVDRAEPRAIPGTKHADGDKKNTSNMHSVFLAFKLPITYRLVKQSIFWTKLGAFILAVIGFPFPLHFFTAVVSRRY